MPVFRPEAAQTFFGRLRTWIDDAYDVVIVVASMVLGFWLIGKSIYSIASS